MIDAIINVYGKPWQTLCTLQSLINTSLGAIDKIYFIREREQPYDDPGERELWRLKNKGTQLIYYTPTWYVFQAHEIASSSNPDLRYGIRYQYGIEHSNKHFVLVTHNDVLYQKNIIQAFLEKVEWGDAGIGRIGQCWNCPGSHHKLCNSDKFGTWTPTYEEVMALGLPHVRTHVGSVDKHQPFPLPECRLNEWCALINRYVCIKECKPLGDVPLFGSNAGLDTACGWFKQLYLKGYEFKHFDINQYIQHGYWAKNSGYPTQLDRDKYFAAEEEAKKYYEQHFKSD